jgi:hypothetical protein
MEKWGLKLAREWGISPETGRIIALKWFEEWKIITDDLLEEIGSELDPLELEYTVSDEFIDGFPYSIDFDFIKDLPEEERVILGEAITSVLEGADFPLEQEFIEQLPNMEPLEESKLIEDATYLLVGKARGLQSILNSIIRDAKFATSDTSKALEHIQKAGHELMAALKELS